MGFNYGLEKRKFTEEWKKLYREYKAAGMSEEDIQDIYAFDLNVFRKNRTEFQRTQPLSESFCDDGTEQGESSRCNERRTEIGGDDALAVELAQNVQIIEISHAGVGGGAGHDSFQLLSQNSFQIARQNFNGTILQHQLEAVTHFAGRDGVAGGNVDLERRYHAVKLRFHADTDARILSLVHDLGNALQPELHAIVHRYGDDGGDHILYFFDADRRTLYGCVNVHRGAGVKADHCGHQHPAFEDELVPIFRKRNALQKPLHHVIAHQDLRICRFVLGEIANQVFELPCSLYHVPDLFSQERIARLSLP